MQTLLLEAPSASLCPFQLPNFLIVGKMMLKSVFKSDQNRCLIKVVTLIFGGI